MDADVGVTPTKGIDKDSVSVHSQSGIKYHGSKGLLDLSWLADQASQQNQQMDVSYDEKIVTTEDLEGHRERTTSVSATVIMSDIEEDGEGMV